MSTRILSTGRLYFNPRLTKALAAVGTYPIFYVQAPSGYGKSSAVRHFLLARKIRAFWTPVDSPREDRFWLEFCTALEHAAPNAAERVESLRQMGYPYDSVLRTAAIELLGSIVFEERTLLVVDDLHQLPSPGFALLCEELALSGIENLYLVLISRAPFEGNEERLRQNGLFAALGTEELALSPEEVAEYYTRCGLPLSGADAKILRNLTEGWISALRLYMPSYAQSGAPEKPLAIAQLVQKEIYGPLPAPLKRLLVAVSPLERFSLEQAEAVSGVENAWELLFPLLQRNAFLTQNKENGQFTLHAIFRDFLKSRFSKLPKEERIALHLKSGDWFLTQSDVLSAIEAYYAAGDFTKALASFKMDMNQGLVTSQARFFLRFFKECPPDILNQHLAAGFKYAIAAFTSADYPAFGAQMAALTAQLEQGSPKDPENKIWRGELQFLHSLMAYNDIAAMSEHHKKANALLGRPTRLFGQHSPWTLGSPSVLFMFHRAAGQLSRELDLMHECMPHYYCLAAGHGSGGEFIMEAESCYYAGDFEQAAIICRMAEAFAMQYNQLSNALCCMFLRMRLALAEGNIEQAAAIPDAMRTRIQDKRDFFLLYTADLCEAHLYAVLGEARAAPGWVRGEGGNLRLYAFAAGYYYILHGKLLLLEGQHARLIGLLTQLLDQGPFKNHLIFTLYARIHLAAACQATGDEKTALEHLRIALELALPDGLYMPFVENSAELLPLLHMLEEEAQWQRRLLPVFSLCDWTARRWRGETPPLAAPPRLTTREWELMRLSVSDKSYPEIAEELDLAASTVKRAYATIFKKLDLHGRPELRELLRRSPPLIF